MIGQVDEARRAILAVELRCKSEAPGHVVSVWIDTGFTGDLVLPQSLIEQLALPLAGVAEAILADGSQVSLKVYSCSVLWFDQVLELEVVANEGACPLLGIGMLRHRGLNINFRSKTVYVS
jgi:clan AA aspartic protease